MRPLLPEARDRAVDDPVGHVVRPDAEPRGDARAEPLDHDVGARAERPAELRLRLNGPIVYGVPAAPAGIVDSSVSELLVDAARIVQPSAQRLTKMMFEVRPSPPVSWDGSSHWNSRGCRAGSSAAAGAAVAARQARRPRARAGERIPPVYYRSSSAVT
jgi:hypothetical protein